jgi:hypothetical protein
LKRKQSLTSKVLLLARVKESLRQIAVEKDTLMNNKSSLNLTKCCSLKYSKSKKFNYIGKVS